MWRVLLPKNQSHLTVVPLRQNDVLLARSPFDQLDQFSARQPDHHRGGAGWSAGHYREASADSHSADVPLRQTRAQRNAGSLGLAVGGSKGMVQAFLRVCCRLVGGRLCLHDTSILHGQTGARHCDKLSGHDGHKQTRGSHYTDRNVDCYDADHAAVPATLLRDLDTYTTSARSFRFSRKLKDSLAPGQ
uniref:Uncharacterized protein n=1 Tax=Anopheles atroparvus TaxID=41427 RepID=A0AAG5D7F1_ANOAO